MRRKAASNCNVYNYKCTRIHTTATHLTSGALHNLSELWATQYGLEVTVSQTNAKF